MTNPEAARRANSILATPQEKLSAMRGDMAQDDEALPPFRHWVEDDYPEDDRDDGINFFRGLINGLLLTALFVAVGYGFWIITS